MNIDIKITITAHIFFSFFILSESTVFANQTDTIIGEYFDRRIEKGTPHPEKRAPLQSDLTSNINISDKKEFQEIDSTFKLTVGALNSRKVDQLTALAFSIETLGYFSENRYQFRNIFDHNQFSMIDYYTQKRATYQEERFESKLMANNVLGTLSFFTLFEFFKASQSNKRATNIEFNFAFLATEYNFIDHRSQIKKGGWENIIISYMPVYQFLNVNKLNNQNNYLDKKSHEYLIHTLGLILQLRVKQNIILINNLTYGIVRDVKEGRYQLKNSELNNRFDLLFEIDREINIFYRIDYTQDQKRQLFYNLPPSDLVQSINFSYTW